MYYLCAGLVGRRRKVWRGHGGFSISGPQQRRVLAGIDPMKVVREGSALLGRKVGDYGAGHRVHGAAKVDRDVMIYVLWETGLFRNEDIGRLFGISYSAVSHAISNVKLNRTDPLVRSKLDKINSQFKM